MNMDITTIIIILAYVYIMTGVLKSNDTGMMVLVTGVMIVYLYVKNKNDKIEGFNINSHDWAHIGCSHGQCHSDPGHGSCQLCKEKKCNGSTIRCKDPTCEICNPPEKAPDALLAPSTPPPEPKKKEVQPNDIDVGFMKSFNHEYGPTAKMGHYDGLCLTTGNHDSWRKSPSDVSLNSSSGLYTSQGHTLPTKPLFSDPSSLSGPPIDGVDGSPTQLFMLGNNAVSPDCCPSTFSTSTGCLCTTHNQREYIRHRGHNSSGCNQTI